MIRKVETKMDISLFSKMGIEFSRGYPNSIPKFFKNEIDNFNPLKNYFQRIGGKLQAYIYEADGNVKGRIAAMIHPENCKTGLIGLFDVVNNEDIAKELIQTAIDFLSSEGCDSIIAPVDFSIFHSYRFMTSGFDQAAFPGEPRNPSYYPDLFIKSGFSEYNSWDSRFYSKSSLNEFLEENKSHYQSFIELGYTFEKLNANNKTRLMKQTYEILIKSYRVFPLFTHISEEDFLQEYFLMPEIMDRNCSLFGYTPKDEFFGFILVIKDLTTAMKSMNGKTNLISKIKFLWYKNQSQTANIAQGATVPYFIREAAILGRNKTGKPFSLASAMSYMVVDEILKSKKYNSAIISLIRKEGQMKNHFHKPDLIRNYSLYQKKL